jgi:hypothetical protein
MQPDYVGDVDGGIFRLWQADSQRPVPWSFNARPRALMEML